ncbi:MAG: ATP-grasp domain-containing protein, partial [Deltaproteobacteria bacterium]|nr:ATP-grasp domain-containing protein [Deltaproteobacteria bacterium]
MKGKSRPRIIVVYNRDFEGAEADPENKAREDVRYVADHLVGVLESRGLAVTALGVHDDVGETLAAIRKCAPDVVFNLCESICGDSRFEPLLPLLMEKEGISFTGSGSFALSLALHKHKAKEILRARQVPTPHATLLSRADAPARLPFPLIVKPSREDASVGIYSESVVSTDAALETRVAHVISQYHQPALVEQYIEGREIYVSLLGRPGAPPEVLPFFEIDFSGLPADRPRIVSFEGKWVESSVEYEGTKPVLCDLSGELRERVGEAARGAFEALELRDYGRVDIRLDAGGTPYVIDVNPNCDLSHQAGGFARAARAAGLTYDDVVFRILDLALSRRSNADTIPLAVRSRRDRRADHAGPLPNGGDLVR